MLEEYITSLEKQDKSPKTIISYRNDIRIFMDDLHIQPDHFVTATDVRKWINVMLHPNDGKPLAITTINRRLNSLRVFIHGRKNIESCIITQWKKLMI